MKILSLLLGSSILGLSVHSHPLDLPFKLSQDEIETLVKRQTTIVPAAGVSGSTEPRYEIRQLKSEQPNQFTLFILAMQQFQAQAQTDVTSYYQIAGIHGVPRQDFNGVGECSTCSNVDGYCTHDSVLFPAWHRAYMAMFEQQLQSVAASIAASWPTSGNSVSRKTMKAAAQALRMPYWDWAAQPPNGGHNLPGVVSTSTITINGPSGQETITNPLFKHTFTNPGNLYYSPFVKWTNTLRYPTSDAKTATSNDASCVAAFDNIRASLQDQVYQLFSTCTDYLHFSNDDAGSSTTSCSNSLEGIHNTIHTTAGGVPSTSVSTVGHMYYLSLAAFDPVFWLHHCNVDRLFAMWQTINSGSYGASQAAPHNTWTIAQGTTQDASSPLTPFYTDTTGSTFWTTDTVQDFADTFHYTYPEFADSDGSATAIQSYVNALYGPSATATAGSSKRTAMPEPVAAAEALSTPEPKFPTIQERSVLPGVTAQNGSTFQYVANIKTPRYALDGSYYVFLFLGPPSSEDPSTWIFDQNLVGPMGVPSQADMMMRNVTAAGSIPLTRALTSKFNAGVLTNLTEATVAPFLKSMLEWRIAGPKGTEVDPDSVAGFEVAVYASTSTVPSNSTSLPVYSDFIPLTEVTKGKKGGVSSLL